MSSFRKTAEEGTWCFTVDIRHWLIRGRVLGKEVAYLFEGGARPSAFDDIEHAQILHYDFIKMDEHRTGTARETQRLVAKEGKVGATFNEVEAILGKAYIAELNMLAEGLALRAAENEAVYLKAFASLRNALRNHFKQTWRYRVAYAYRMRHDATIEDMLTKLRPRLDPGFNADELPSLPTDPRKSVDNTLAGRIQDRGREGGGVNA